MPVFDSDFSENVTASIRRRTLWRMVACISVAVWFAPPAAMAAVNQTVVVRNDRGGSVIERARLIDEYNANGTRIEIRGDFCMSACTMYLKLKTTCVAPDTRFGFHGPSSRIYGISLGPAAFERWSRVMADHYPEPLRSWFLNEGRYRIVGYQEFSGRDLIRLGITGCDT